jgi:predicted lipoprotein with Yx(FWY)xxD motif
VQKPKLYVAKDILEHEAFRSLTGTAKNVLFDFVLKFEFDQVKKPRRKKENVLKNEKNLVYTYLEAAEKGMSAGVFIRAIDELINKGWFNIVHAGHGGKGPDGKHGDVTRYEYSDRWKHYGTPLFVANPRKKDTREGRGFALRTRKMRVYWARSKGQT